MTSTTDTTTTTTTFNTNLKPKPRPLKTSVEDDLSGRQYSWHGKITNNDDNDNDNDGDGDGKFKPEEGRYWLYIGLFCPFAHRVNLIRHLCNLTTTIPISIVLPYPKGDETGWPGWKFPQTTTEYPGSTPDHLYNSEYLHDIYFKCDDKYQGRYTVPVLWDRKLEEIVCNESDELMRWLPYAFDNNNNTTNNEKGEKGEKEKEETTKKLDFYPPELRTQIDQISHWMQRDLNTGVYKAGFAETQSEYDRNVLPVFAALNKLEKIIAENKGPFVLGKKLTELDIRLYPTIIRFDVVYVQHFKCNLGMIRSDYPQIWNWMKGLFWGEAELEEDSGGRKVYGFGEGEGGTTDFKHIKENYTKSHGGINPRGITPRGPWPDVEKGYERDFGKVKVGGIGMLEVVELEDRLG